MKTGKELNAKKWACRKLFDPAADDSSDGKMFCEKERRGVIWDKNFGKVRELWIR